ncbi:hypothetical protein C9374_008237 [Naegleria lovaniensis]|uniref:U-box domain-containing protein n=1 Tax=Naegleria lovaniensis TaxID=51637 RepID=A0AA88KI78_NAELO|nr:uncharacterized protein C9374_008237 [Naegleria lovaniensis]KAG2378598.1 hypothetical protein C9374_008237 [Naegleria lovaniensis]
MTMSVTATTTTTALQKDMMMMSVQHAPNEPSLINYEEDAFGTGVSAILNPSDELFCPISHTIMSEPVIAADGRTYEKELITQWLREHNGTSPFTRENIGTNTIENVHIKNEIQRFFTTLKSLESDHCAFQYHLSNDVFLPCSMLVEFQHAVSKNDLNTVKTLYDNDIRLLLYSPEMLNDFVNHNISSLVRANNFSSKSLISYSLNGYELCCKIGSLEMIEDMYNFLSRSSLNRPLPPLANETNIERTH